VKALTLTQPWATLVAIGAKRYETRSWGTDYRGPLAIHAAKGFPMWARALCDELPFQVVLSGAGYYWHTLPVGKVLACCQLVACSKIAFGNDPLWPSGRSLSENERAFGDWTPGRYAWELADVVLLLEPIPAKGALGLWEWTDRRMHG